VTHGKPGDAVFHCFGISVYESSAIHCLPLAITASSRAVTGQQLKLSVCERICLRIGLHAAAKVTVETRQRGSALPSA